jgi:hypothetical protein
MFGLLRHGLFDVSQSDRPFSDRPFFELTLPLPREEPRHDRPTHRFCLLRGGLGKPRRHTQFKKGQSGNPGGRPRRLPAERLKELALREAYCGVVVMENGRAEPLPAIQAVPRSQIELAASGNVRAQRAILAMIQDIEQAAGPDLCEPVNSDGAGDVYAGNDDGADDANDADDASVIDGGVDDDPDDIDADAAAQQEEWEWAAAPPPIERWREPPSPEPPQPPVVPWRDRPPRPGSDLRGIWRESGERERW